jgi:hypothetical protein
MMLSQSAARLGTSIRLKGKSIPFRPYSFANRWMNDVARSISNTASPRIVKNRVVSDTAVDRRYKSTVSAVEYDVDEVNRITTPNTLGLSYLGHSAAAEYRLQQQQQQQNQDPTQIVASEPWRINLGRGDDNAWLMGVRNDQEWFTGIAPADSCPGTFVLFSPKRCARVVEIDNSHLDFPLSLQEPMNMVVYDRCRCRIYPTSHGVMR